MRILLLFSTFIFISLPSFAQTLDLDENFKKDLIAFGVDTDGDGEIQLLEAEQIDSLEIGRYHNGITDLSSIIHFKNLKYLFIWAADQVETLDISSLKQLEHFSAFEWTVRNVIADNLENLTYFGTGFGTASISIDGTENLEWFSSYDNYGLIHDLDYSKLTKLKDLTLGGIPAFQELNLDGCINLENLTLHPMGSAGYLEALTIKNGRHTNIDLHAWSTERNFKYICTDDEEVGYVNEVLREKNYNQFEVNSYCTFEKGGGLKKVSGVSRIDYNGNGCDLDDPVMPFLRYEISDNNTSTSEIRTSYSNDGFDGGYAFRARPGTYRIKPLIDNPEYFSITPEMQEITIADYDSDAFLDFCIKPNASKNDARVTISPLRRARPGFTGEYWITIKNQGSTPLSGELSLTFDNNVMEFVSSSLEAESLDHGEMIWNYSDLQPGEYRGIRIEMLLNKPTDTEFPLMGDEKLVFEANVNHAAEDESPEDNTFILNQQVVNSHDPNDITMLEGDEISFMKTGEYVHYMVRFENTGTAEAVNIVVKDTIDTEKFELESLRPLEGSHTYKTRIQNNGIVEFIFENINLPFTEDEKHGFVVFKIKTKASLVEGDQFSNDAAIYFDYNFPIFTNEYETEVVGLSVLPVRLSSFDAQQRDSDIDLNWVVQSEENLSHYIVERKHEYDDDFYEVAEVKAANLNSYKTTDKSAKESGTNYYRLKIVDNDGSIDFSEVIAISYESKSDANVLIYPNPATELIVVENNYATSQELSILDAAGKEVMRINIPAQSKKEIGLSTFNKGLHFFSYVVEDKLEVKKIIID